MRERRWQTFLASCLTKNPSKEWALPIWKEPLRCSKRRKKPNLLLFDDHLNAAVFGAPCFRIVAGNRVTVPVACGR